MSFFSSLNIGTAKGKKDIQLRIGSNPLLTIHAQGLALIINSIPDIMEYLSSLSASPETLSLVKETSKVDQLIQTYLRMRNEYFGRKSSSAVYKKGSPQYTHFSKALEIIDTHEVTYEYFIKAQIDGLEFLKTIGSKSEAFPQPGYLSTAEAETRLLKYMSKADNKQRPIILLSQKEKDTPLKQNNKFIDLLQEFKTRKNISLEDAVYLEQCYVARKRPVLPELTEYINSKL